jgi:transglutaminase-like putative cysteine protease
LVKPLRTALLALLPAALIATGWRQLELPAEGREIALVALLGVVVALIPGRRLRLLAGLGAFLAAVGLAFGLSPLDARPFDRDRDFVGPLLSQVWNGTLDYYEVSLPFNPAERGRMHGIVLLAVFAFTLAASLAIARRRAILAAAITFAGAAWPVTLIRDAPSTARGALLLVSALILLLAVRGAESRRVSGQTVLVGAGVLLAALIAVSSPAVAKGGFLNWERWEPYTRPQNPVEVTYVWKANYDGIKFPKQATTVLTIEAPRSASYWRATTLDSFTDGHWTESSDMIEPVEIEDRDALITGPLVPPAARDPEKWIEQEVRVRALQDRHLVGATVPMAYEQGEADAYSPGVAHIGRLRRDQKYKVWSYVVQPRPRQLAASPPDYPEEIASGAAFLGTPSGFIPPFGTRGRDALMRTLLEEDLGDPRYRRLLDVAREVVGSPRNPYGAVIALEAWFRSGEFSYDESPPVSRNVPPLVAFVTDHRRGYCQHFAGAMALMLRYLGIPARVGAGFTTGRYNVNRGEWTVADTNAHTWVEVWFAGYGWLPFDPTPGRGRLLSSYTASSFSFDVSGAQGAVVSGLGLEALRSGAQDSERLRGLDPGARSSGEEGDGSFGDGGPGGSLIGLVLLIAAGLTAALWAFKLLRRRARYLTDDPRRLAGAVRLDLVDFLVDQRFPISASATPAEVGRELERSLDVPGDRLAGTLAEARYGPDAGAAEAVVRARRELRAVRGRIRRRLGFRDRLRGLLSLRSLGLGSGSG